MSKIKYIKQILEKEKLDGVIISTVSHINYLTGFSNFSKDEREAYLLITAKENFIFTDGRYTEAVKKQVKDFKLIEISSQNPLKKILKILSSKLHIYNVGIDEENLTVKEYKMINLIFKNIIPLKSFYIRSVKTSDEIEKIKKACQIADQGFKYLLTKIKLGVSEKDLAFELEFFIRKKGTHLSFNPIIAFSNNSSVPHHQTGEAILRKKMGEFILIDMGVKYDGYCSDMTRTLFFGKATDKQKEIYKIVLEAQKIAIKFIETCLKNNKKIRAKEVDKIAREYIKKVGYPTIPHSLGHGIGLEVHEAPSLSPKSKHELKEGMVFSIEPGIYLEGFGGVRIEDLFVIEKNNLRQLTKSPKHLTEL